MNLDGDLSVVALNFANNIAKCVFKFWLFKQYIQESSELHHTM